MMSNVQTRKNRRVALLGATRNTDNYGVRVLLTSAVEALSALEPTADIILLDYGRRSEAWDEHTSIGERAVRLVNLRFSWKLHLANNIFRLLFLAVVLHIIPGKGWKQRVYLRNPWLDEVLQADTHYSLAGGDSFSDVYGLERFVYVALPQILVLLLRRPLILLPQTYGPCKGLVCRALARWILCNAEKIYSRDTAGVETVHALTGYTRPPVHVVPDLGFGMQATPVSEATLSKLENLRHQRPLVGLNVSRLLYIGGYTGDNMFGLREDFPLLVENLAKYIALDLDADVLLVPHVCGGPSSQEDETRLCKSLEAAFSPQTGGRVHYLDQVFDHQQMKTVIGQCDVFVGARMHACIGAVSQGVPTVCLAYSSKFAGVMRPLGAAARVVDLRTATIQATKAIVEEVFLARDSLRKRLAAEVPNIRNDARHLGSSGVGNEATCHPKSIQ
jgi:colanic acid/amylovoran biosynthesis protein